MSAHDFQSDGVDSMQHGLVVLGGKLTGNGAFAPSFANAPWIESIARNGSTKRLTITLKRKWASLVALHFCYQDTGYGDAATRKEAVVVTEAVATDRTIVVQIENARDGGSNAAADLDSTQALFVTAIVKDTTSTP